MSSTPRAAKDLEDLSQTVTVVLGDAEDRAAKAVAELTTHEQEARSLEQRLGAAERERERLLHERRLFVTALYNKSLRGRTGPERKAARGQSPRRDRSYAADAVAEQQVAHLAPAAHGAPSAAATQPQKLPVASAEPIAPDGAEAAPAAAAATAHAGNDP